MLEEFEAWHLCKRFYKVALIIVAFVIAYLTLIDEMQAIGEKLKHGLCRVAWGGEQQYAIWHEHALNFS